MHDLQPVIVHDYTAACVLQVGDENPQPPKDPDTLAAAGKWMDCRAFVKLLHSIQTHSQVGWHKTGSSMQAREVHDAILACVMITHLPPLRLSMIRSMLYTAPDEACTPCKHPDCRRADCEGNRLYVESTSPLRLRMKFPHHKNENKWKHAVIDFIVPEELAELLHMYLEGPRRQLMCSTCSTVFMDLQGRPFDISSSFCSYWQRFLVSHGAPALNPSICRQIFVVERMSEGAAVGPSNRGAAMVMGHSVKQWHDWYDLKFHSRLAQDAVNSMQDWRQSLLDGEAAPASVPRRHAQIMYTDSESDSETVQPQQPASATTMQHQRPASADLQQTAAPSQQQKMAAVHTPEVTAASQQQQMAPEPECIVISDSDSDLELWV